MTNEKTHLANFPKTDILEIQNLGFLKPFVCFLPEIRAVPSANWSNPRQSWQNWMPKHQSRFENFSLGKIGFVFRSNSCVFDLNSQNFRLRTIFVGSTNFNLDTWRKWRICLTSWWFFWDLFVWVLSGWFVCQIGCHQSDGKSLSCHSSKLLHKKRNLSNFALFSTLFSRNWLGKACPGNAS